MTKESFEYIQKKIYGKISDFDIDNSSSLKRAPRIFLLPEFKIRELNDLYIFCLQIQQVCNLYEK